MIATYVAFISEEEKYCIQSSFGWKMEDEWNRLKRIKTLTD